jgi:hypothetical protein
MAGQWHWGKARKERSDVKNLSDGRALRVDDAKANLGLRVEGLKADSKLNLAFNGGTIGECYRAVCRRERRNW